MGKIYGIALIVVGIWVGMTIFTEGLDNAFGGIFTKIGAEPVGRDVRAPTERIRDRVQSAADERTERIERLVGDSR